MIRCDECGRFIAYADLESGAAVSRLVTPDSDRSREEYETLCVKHVSMVRPRHELESPASLDRRVPRPG